jgi:hypothetical protein
MAKKTANTASGKKTASAPGPGPRSRALRQTSFGPIIRVITKTEGQIRKFRGTDADERAKEKAIAFLDKMRTQFSTKCQPVDDDDEDFKNIPFSLAKRNK